MSLHVVGDGLLHHVVEPLLEGQAPSWPWAIVAPVVGTAIVWWGLRDFERSEPNTRTVPSDVVIAVFLGGASAVGVATAIFGLLEMMAGHHHELGAAASAAYVTVFVLASLKASAFYKNRTPVIEVREPSSTSEGVLEMTETPFEPRRVLVVFLSTLTAAPLGGTLTGDLEQDLAGLKAAKREALAAGRRPEYWNAEPLLAGVHANFRSGIGPLIRLVVVPSRESKKDIPKFLEVMARYAELRSLKIQVLLRDPEPPYGFRLVSVVAGGGQGEVPAGEAVSFEDVPALYDAMAAVYEAVIDHWSMTDADLTIDFTGGQKPASVVAAVASFNRVIRAQYVQTGEPWDVKHYDLVIAENPPIG